MGMVDHGKLAYGRGNVHDQNRVPTNDVDQQSFPSEVAANKAVASPTNEFMQLHVLTKNLRSIRSDDKFEDLLVEIDEVEFDLACLSETWRSEKEEFWTTNGGKQTYLSGGSTSRGVGICVSHQIARRMAHVTLHAYSDRLCSLHFSLGNLWFRMFACYFPTSWEPDSEADELFDVLALLVDNCNRCGAMALVAGDFNVSICWRAGNT